MERGVRGGVEGWLNRWNVWKGGLSDIPALWGSC